MKLTDIAKEKIKVEEAVLLEKLGTLAQLGVGPLLNILKQEKGGRHGLMPVGKKFARRYSYSQIGSTSKIVDIGVVKKGLTDIRKAYKDLGYAQAFALYIGGKPIAFAIFDSDALAGSTRTGLMSYDLSAFKPAIDQIDKERADAEQAKSSWARRPPEPTRITTAHDKEERRYDSRKDTYDVSSYRYQGEIYATSQLKEFFQLADKIAEIAGQPITAKVVMGDKIAAEKHQKRMSAQQIDAGADDLRTRLAKYKNTKKPTAENVEDFIAMSLKNPGKQARFAGVTYSLKSTSYDKVDPMELLKGKPFTVRYSSVDPGSYDSLELVYAYNLQNNQLLPIYATWYDKSDPSNRYKRQEHVLDPEGYLRMKIGVADLEDKTAVIKKLLEKFKSSQYYEVLLLVDSLKKTGIDWPELDAVQKSAKIEYDKTKKA